MGFRGSNASGRRIDAFTRRILGARMPPKWPFWAHLSYSVFTVFQSLGGHASKTGACRMKPCCRQAHCFVQGPLRFFPVFPLNPTCTRCPHLGPSNLSGLKRAFTFSRTRFGSFFGSFFAFFKPSFRIDLKSFGGNFVLQTCRPNILGHPRTPRQMPFYTVERRENPHQRVQGQRKNCC